MKAHTRMWVLTFVAAAILMVSPASGQGAQSWLHVQVAGDEDGSRSVALNVPLSAVEAVMVMIPTEVLSKEGRLTIAERNGFSVSALRQMWSRVKRAGDTEVVTFQHGDETVRIVQSGSLIELQVEDETETVRVDMPVGIVDALLSGDGATINVAAAIDELSALRGDVVRVTGSEQQVRIWIDEQNTQ